MTNLENKSALIIEDEKSMRDALVNLFQIAKFKKVYEADDGRTGLANALQHHPDIIILDLMLPKMNGLDVMRQLRKDSWGKSVPIIILTVLEESDEINQSITENEPSYYLIKTNVTIDDVLVKVKEVLG